MLASGRDGVENVDQFLTAACFTEPKLTLFFQSLTSHKENLLSPVHEHKRLHFILDAALGLLPTNRYTHSYTHRHTHT